MGIPEQTNRITNINRRISALKDELEELKKYPKINARKIKVIGSQLTRLNYTAGNQLSILDKMYEETPNEPQLR